MSETVTTETAAEPVDYEVPGVGAHTTDLEADPEPAKADAPAEGEKAEEKPDDKAEDKPKGRSLVGDLQAERERRKAAESVAREQQEFLDAWRPLIERLHGRTDLQEALMAGKLTISQAEEIKNRDEVNELTEIAQDHGWYKDDGITLDIDRAKRQQAREQKHAERVAKTQMQPLLQDGIQRKALDRVEFAVQYAIKTGDADPTIVREELTRWASKNPGALLDNEQGNLLYDRCVALTARAAKSGVRKPATTTARPEVAEVEAAGGKSRGPNLTSTEKALMKEWGLTEKDVARGEAHTAVRRGYTNLEEE